MPQTNLSKKCGGGGGGVSKESRRTAGPRLRPAPGRGAALGARPLLPCARGRAGPGVGRGEDGAGMVCLGIRGLGWPASGTSATPWRVCQNKSRTAIFGRAPGLYRPRRRRGGPGSGRGARARARLGLGSPRLPPPPPPPPPAPPRGPAPALRARLKGPTHRPRTPPRASVYATKDAEPPPPSRLWSGGEGPPPRLPPVEGGREWRTPGARRGLNAGADPSRARRDGAAAGGVAPSWQFSLLRSPFGTLHKKFCLYTYRGRFLSRDLSFYSAFRNPVPAGPKERVLDVRNQAPRGALGRSGGRGRAGLEGRLSPRWRPDSPGPCRRSGAPEGWVFVAGVCLGKTTGLGKEEESPVEKILRVGLIGSRLLGGNPRPRNFSRGARPSAPPDGTATAPVAG